MSKLFFSLAFLICISANAADAVQLDGEEITAVLSDRSLYAGKKGEVEQIFQKGGQAVYIDHGNASQGTWFVKNDKYCSVWPPSANEACYVVTRNGDVVTFISGTGTEYPMRLAK